MTKEIGFNQLSTWLKVCAICGFVGGLYVAMIVLVAIFLIIVGF